MSFEFLFVEFSAENIFSFTVHAIYISRVRYQLVFTATREGNFTTELKTFVTFGAAPAFQFLPFFCVQTKTFVTAAVRCGGS